MKRIPYRQRLAITADGKPLQQFFLLARGDIRSDAQLIRRRAKSPTRGRKASALDEKLVPFDSSSCQPENTRGFCSMWLGVEADGPSDAIQLMVNHGHRTIDAYLELVRRMIGRGDVVWLTEVRRRLLRIVAADRRKPQRRQRQRGFSAVKD